MSRLLSKSRFAIALECPTKLYYYSHPQEYVNNSVSDDFLKALAEGGIQVGALARAYYPEGVLVNELNVDAALEKTKQLLQHENIVLFEPAFRYGNFLMRADILIKKAHRYELIEVKAKSIRPEEQFTGTKGYLSASWHDYIYDVAYQKYILKHYFPDRKVSAYLMLMDKSKAATVDHLNQLFFLKHVNRRAAVELKGDISPATLGEPIMIKKNVDDIIDRVFKGTDTLIGQAESFEQRIHLWAEAYSNDKKLSPVLTKACSKCEFKANEQQMFEGRRSGFHQCWQERAGFSINDFERPSVLNIWRYSGKDEAIFNRKYFQEQFDRNDFEPAHPSKKVIIGWSATDRQELQVVKSKQNDNTHSIYYDVLRDHLSLWKFPLHMIDFETTRVPIPFNKGRRPYEQVAFQFSHHIVERDGKVSHAGQWINTQPGHFPNFDFVRELRKELEKDEGTIFRYALHENSVLNDIKVQLESSEESDKEELIKFIMSITRSSKDSTTQWTGERDMVDLLEILTRCYYHPATNGSNSLKYVLPAVVNSSEYLQEKYSKPNYGIDIRSLNFFGHQWLRKDENTGKIINPYKTLPLIHEGIDNELLDDLIIDEGAGIYDGGAAMTAYARMQFTEMSDEERARITNALLRYCELDTLAMVMLYEAWREWCS